MPARPGGVRRDEVIFLFKLEQDKRPHCFLRRIEFWDAEHQRLLVFLTNHLTLAASTIAAVYKDRWQIGVSRQGHIFQSVRDRPRSKDSDLVAREALWRESKTAEPSDKHARKGVCATHQVATCSERRRSLVTRISGG